MCKSLQGVSGQRCSGQSRQGPEAPGVNGGSRGEIGMAGGIEVTRVLELMLGVLMFSYRARREPQEFWHLA